MRKNEETLERELLWRQYALHVDLYKFYLDLTVKVNVFYYAITGAILTYYFQHAVDKSIARFALLLPIVFSIAIGGIFFYGAHLLSVTREELFAIRDRLDLETAPEIGVLAVFLRSFGTIMVLTGLGLAVFFFVGRT